MNRIIQHEGNCYLVGAPLTAAEVAAFYQAAPTVAPVAPTSSKGAPYGFATPVKAEPYAGMVTPRQVAGIKRRMRNKNLSYLSYTDQAIITNRQYNSITCKRANLLIKALDACPRSY